MTYYKLICLFIFLQVAIFTTVTAQVDSSYIVPFKEDFSARIYFINRIKGLENNKKEMYNINAPTAIGIGISWQDYSLSFGHGWSVLSKKNKGKTKTLEFEYHGYKRKYVYDVSLHKHKGFYKTESLNDNIISLHPDMRVNLYGGSFMWIFNNKKFSYKAAFNQSERQLKSAGSFQLGSSLYYSKIKSDTNNDFENLQFGIIGGYAYTWVLNKDWYITGSSSIGLNIGNTPNHFFQKKLNVYPTLNNRFAAGYNHDNWSFVFSSYFNRMHFVLNRDDRVSMNDAKLQMTIVKRFDWDNKFVNNTLNKGKKILNRFGL